MTHALLQHSLVTSDGHLVLVAPGFVACMFQHLSVVIIFKKRFWRDLAENLPTLIDFVATSDEQMAHLFIMIVSDLAVNTY